MLPVDPLADLKAELAAEAAAGTTDGEEEATAAPVAAAAVAATDDEDPDAKADDDAKDEKPAAPAPKAAKDDKPAAPKPKADADRPKFVPVSRVNEETAKRRRAERDLAAANERLAALEAAPPGKDAKPVSEDDRKKVVAEARQMARLEVMAENFVNAGYDEYGAKEFDSVSSSLSDLGAPDNLVVIAVEATGSAAKAARAIYNLGQQEAEVIEAFFRLPPLRMAAKLEALASAPKAEAPTEEDDEADKKPAGGKKSNGKVSGEVSRAPAPIAPVGGRAAAANDDDITDDLSEDQFTERFGKLMDRRFERRNR